MAEHIVIVGAGHAGVEAAHALRQRGFAGTLTLIGGETDLPYQRPPLSKEFLKREANDVLPLKAKPLYERNAIDLRLGQWVSAVDRDRRCVVVEGSEEVAYDHLVLAPGARNRRLPIPGADDRAVLELRDLEHSRQIRAAVEGRHSVVIVGGGFIGLELAAVLRESGIEVDVVEMAERVMGRAVSSAVSDHFRAVHEGLGTRLHLGRRVVAIAREETGHAVDLDDGTRLHAGRVIVAAGVVPNVELAAEAGLCVADGIVVDEMLLTSDQAISAIGDCVAFPSVHAGTTVRLESVQNALDQARAVAARLTGAPAPYTSLPWFWSNQGPARLQIAGIGSVGDRPVIRGEPASGRFGVFLYRGERLVAVESVNSPGEHMAARRLLENAVPLAPEAAADPSVDLKALLKRAAGGGG